MLYIHLVFKWFIWCCKCLLLSTSLCPRPGNWKWHDISLATSVGSIITPILFFWYPTKAEAYNKIMAFSSNIILQKLYCMSVRKGIPKPVPAFTGTWDNFSVGSVQRARTIPAWQWKNRVMILKRFTASGRILLAAGQRRAPFCVLW